MKKGKLIFWIIIIIGSVYVFSLASKNIDPTKSFYFNDFKQINVAGNEFFAKFVSSEAERARGLSGVDRMDDNSGMVFVFETPAQHGFWMKDMNFAIDIIWIGEDMKIVDITENFAPETYPEVIRPIEPALYVLEINAGIASKLGLKKGDLITF